jgi:AcrR family transcriptional regulator
VVTRCDVADHVFFELFGSVDECVIAAFDEGVARVTRLIVEAARREHSRRERVRAALSALLMFLDRQPGWTHLLVDDSPLATIAVAERRQNALAALARALVGEMHANANSSGWFVPSSHLTAELAVGGVFSVVRARMSDRRGEPLAGLAPVLTDFIIAPDFATSRTPAGAQPGAANEVDPRSRRLPVRTTYRTTRVLSAIGDSPGLSNREIAEAAGLSDEGQTSKLLRRLEQRGLVENFGLGQPHGGANAWRLTAYGARVLDASRHSLVPGAGAVLARRARGAA